MINQLKTAVHQLLIAPSCPLCRSLTAVADLPCNRCKANYQLPEKGLRGLSPLRWHALGPYDGAFRRLLLKLKNRGEAKRAIPALAALLQRQVRPAKDVQLVPIPTWKRTESLRNPLPELIAQGLQHPVRPLLIRPRAGLSQHRLGRTMRQRNMRQAFAVHDAETDRPLWLVDDILTTGATAIAARDALMSAGHRVEGLLCLARTPRSGGDLRSQRRQGDVPG